MGISLRDWHLAKIATLRTAALVSVGAPANLANPHALFALYKMPDLAVYAATQQLLKWAQL